MVKVAGALGSQHRPETRTRRLDECIALKATTADR